MSAQILEKLFGQAARVRLMRLFLFNSGKLFDREDVSKKTRTSLEIVERELELLRGIGLVKTGKFKKDFRNKNRHFRRSVRGYTLNPKFIYLHHLKNLLVNTVPLEGNELAKRVGKVCNPRLILVSGIFLHTDTSRIDLLIVTDSPKESAIKGVITQIESEIGHEIRYTVFSTADFKYRLNLNDHLFRDIFDSPHAILVDKIGL